MESKYVSTDQLRFCVRFNGDSSYEASPWVASNSFTLSLGSTTASILDQPEVTYNVGETYTITVNAASSTGTSLTGGTVTIFYGSGACNASNGMTTGVINQVTTQTVGQAKVYTFAAANVGSDLRFCARYNGDGSQYGPSSYVASSAFRIKMSPSWNIASPITMDVATSTTDKTNFAVADSKWLFTVRVAGDDCGFRRHEGLPYYELPAGFSIPPPAESLPSLTRWPTLPRKTRR